MAEIWKELRELHHIQYMGYKDHDCVFESWQIHGWSESTFFSFLKTGEISEIYVTAMGLDHTTI